MVLNTNFLLIWFFACYCVQGSQQNSDVYNHIFKNYNKKMRPVVKQNTTTLVHIDVGLYSIDEISELTQTITITTWIKYKWKDELLSWDPKKFQNITQIQIPASSIWVPDIVVIGLQEVISYLPDDKTIGPVKYDGQIRMTFLQVVKIHCNFNIKLFPFDTQNCTLRYSSWEYDASQIELEAIIGGFGITQFQENAEWELISYIPERSELKMTDGSRFVEMHYYLGIKRRPVYYIFALVLPSFLITMLALVGLFSPFSSTGERQEKVTMGLTTLLTMSVLLMIITEQMPKKSEMGLPLLGSFILWEIIIASMATCCTVAIMYLHRLAVYGVKPPALLLKAICLSHLQPQKQNEPIQVLPAPSSATEESVESAPASASQINVAEKNQQNKKRQKLTLRNTKPKRNSNSMFKRKPVEKTKNENPPEAHHQTHFKELSMFVAGKQKEEALGEIWRKIVDRLDIISMIFFLCLNFLVTLIMIFAIGVGNQ